MPGWLIDIIQRGRQANQDRALLESLAAYQDQDNSQEDANAGGMAPGGAAMSGASEGAGFNPSKVGNGSEDDGPSPEATRGMQAEALRKVIQAYNPGAKDMHTALKGLGVDQLEGIVKSFSVRSALADQEAQRQDRLAQAAMRRQNAVDDQAAGMFVNNFMRAPEQPVVDPESGENTGETRPATLQERWAHAAKNTPNFGGRVVPKVVDALTKYGALEEVGQAGQPVFREGPFPGTKIAQVPGSKKWQLVNDPNAANMEQAVDDEGKPIPGVYKLGNRAVVTPAAQAATRPVPESFHRSMDQITSDITAAQLTLNEPAADKDKKSRAQRMLQSAQAQGKAIADRYRAAGDISSVLHAQAYADIGLKPPTAATPQKPKGKILVQSRKTGKKFWLPVEQLEEAMKQGYVPVPEDTDQ